MGSHTEVQIFKSVVTFTKEKFISGVDASPEISMKSHKEWKKKTVIVWPGPIISPTWYVG